MMTDKIIINNIDVSNCVFLDKCSQSLCNGFRGDNSGFHQGHCIQNPNCYYKQLARKTEECEKYKQALEEIKEIANLIHFSTLPLHRGFTHDKADEIDAYLNKILQKCEVLND